MDFGLSDSVLNEDLLLRALRWHGLSSPVRDLLELYEERAAIVEYSGKLPRGQAEREARLMVYGYGGGK